MFAFQVLYSLNFEHSEQQLQTTFEHFIQEQQPGTEKENSYAGQLLKGIRDNLDKLDSIISRYSQNWKVKRIAMVEMTIMRLAVYEMLYREDVPVKVAINEAIELAKTFGDNNSRNFVNGILDAVARDILNGKLGPGLES